MTSTKITKIHESLYEVFGTNVDRRIIYIGFIHLEKDSSKWSFKPAFIESFGEDCLDTIVNKIKELNLKNELVTSKNRKLR